MKQNVGGLGIIVKLCGACGCKTTEHHEEGGSLYCQNMGCWGLPACEIVLRPLGNLVSGEKQG